MKSIPASVTAARFCASCPAPDGMCLTLSLRVAAAAGDDELARSHGVLCRGHEGVAARRHRRGARVVSLAREGHPLAPVAHDALDDTDGDPGRLEMRSLFDVKLDVGSERLGIAAS